jgi:hypothetical protein
MSAYAAGDGLFPLPRLRHPYPPERGRRSARRLQQRYKRVLLRVEWANRTILAVNTLYVSVSSSLYFSSTQARTFPTKAQRNIISTLMRSVDHYLMSRPNLLESSSLDSVSDSDLIQLVYHGLTSPHQFVQRPPLRPFSARPLPEAIRDAIVATYQPRPSVSMPIIASKVALPEQACTADLLKLLPAPVAAQYADVKNLLRPVQPGLARAPPSACPRLCLAA